jgi:hypothetical protein
MIMIRTDHPYLRVRHHNGVTSFLHGGEGDAGVDIVGSCPQHVHALDDAPSRSRRGSGGHQSHDFSR